MLKSRLLAAVGMAAFLGGVAGGLRAQSPGRIAFDVASIKPAAPVPNQEPPLGSPSAFQVGGRYVARNTPLVNLLLLAYADTIFRTDQIVGLPSWAISTFFDIQAKVASADAQAEPIPRVPTGAALMKSLLEDRFKLQAHLEKRERQFYAMVLAKGDGTPGPSLRRSSVDCDAVNREREKVRRETLTSPVAAMVNGRPVCAMTMRASGDLVGGSVPLAQLAARVGGIVGGGAEVVDQTGLDGTFDFDLRWSQQNLRSTADATLSDAPSIFTALQEQLGLKLELRRGPRDVVVIDHVERPTPD